MISRACGNPAKALSDHMIIQCFTSRNANIWNVRFHLRQLQWKCKQDKFDEFISPDEGLFERNM